MSSRNAEAPDDSSNSHKSPPPPSDDSDSSTTTPPPQKSSQPPPKSPPPADEDNDTPPPPSPHKNPPPPEVLSPPPSPPPDKSSPPPKHSLPPEKSPPPPASPPPVKFSPPPSLAPPPSPSKAQSPQVVPSTPETPPAPDSTNKDRNKSPSMPIEDHTPPSPNKSHGDLVNSPPALPFKPPPPVIRPHPTTSSLSGSDGGSSGATKSSSGGSSGATGAIIGGVVGGMVFMILLACIWMFCRKKKQKQYNQVWNNLFPSTSPSPDYKQHAINIPPGMPSPTPQRSSWLAVQMPPRSIGVSEGTYNSYNYPNRTPPYSPDMGGFTNQNHLPYEDLVIATDGFSNANMLGQGGFGYVHRGILPNGKEVAVKSLKSGSGQGEREFQAEVDIISRVHHRHLVSLVGYTIAAEKRLLVYEFVPNNTLEYHLHKSNNPPLDFPTRIRIALGSAKGLAYLHEDCHPRIIHRDIKAANILLDYNFEARVADFGLARLYSDANTHVSTRVMGTFGYLAPEYASSGKLTDKSDVFSFGVVLLELITGCRAVNPNDQSMEEGSLVDWARPLLTKALAEENYDELVDRRLNKNYNRQDMTHMVACAAASTRHSAKRRPTMSKVVRTLEGDMSLDAIDGPRTWSTSPSSMEYDTTTYNADMKKFRQIALGTQTFGTTSEYGLNPSSSSDSSSSSNGNSPRHSSN